MIPVVSVATMRAIDAAAAASIEQLIDRAGAAVAREAVDLLGGTYGRRVAVIAGPGNNGADGRVAAARLQQRGVVVVVHPADRCPPRLVGFDLVVDAAYGTGFRGTWEAPDVGSSPVLAVDVPSSLDGDTGAAPVGVLPATRTVTFQALKPGHLLARREIVGDVRVVDIGLDLGPTTMGRVEAADVAAWIPAVAADAHKWRHALRIVAGSPGMTGAAALATSAALRMGASMVVASAPSADPAELGRLPTEAVCRQVSSAWSADVAVDLARFEALLLGPGLGQDPSTLAEARRLLDQCCVPAIVDGDGLVALAEATPSAPDRPPIVITPHDGEFRRLTGAAPGPDRVAAVQRLAGQLGATVLLKGPCTLVADPAGSVRFVADGDQRLATAGTGDVLAGIVGALLARQVAVPEAAAAGAWIHAQAACRGARFGLVAGDLIDQIPIVRESIRR